ncbi:MAG: molybdopterin-synthase adenylyltransferase MoeB [Gammaproteobacteria bacterium]|nr:molybdopterin-synthase adenylyltransferase MoeB [Gammaproteobacteria bacterium]MCW8841196.1 molybdopterin-synthase adenylyltransferase MoeB [Gammaproteobacteria bacterium]MCW8928027.1 molybdopterin-synthase adenylyltransferase MoeB [Gammaproteobacteria bacterium]MCW8972158.1 molybdopterin-synthase adenylyltransferase MoeB [Gammaproteobacteria bacterium]MCW8992453.1 molybdopterin-synthase adenylyltransferase MoeB [Gammaproteobacteria bacterium]
MNDEQLLRYSRQIMLPQLDVAGQQRLLGSHALIIGMGGLGSPVAMYLAAAGVGRLTLVDFDTVDLSNLQRQILHGSDDIGRPKVESAREALAALNPEVVVSTVNRKLEGPALLEAIAGADVVIDASDNFTTRFAINDACVEARKPLVSGAAIRMEGQVSVFHNEREESPCYRCLYRDEGELEQTCSENGVLAPVVGVIGALQATEALKVLAGIGETLGGRLLLWDAMTMEWRSLKLRKDPACPCCGAA